MDTTEVIVRIRKIVRSINLESKRIQKEYGVSIPQVLCLSHLRRSPGFQSTQADIRKYLNLNSSTVSGIIDRLESKGYLARLPKSGDRRVVHITLTTRGDKLLRDLPPLLQDQLSEKLKKLDPESLRTVEEGLEKLIQILDIGSMDASPVISIEGEME